MPLAIPLATYRIQFTADFGFDTAAALAPYLKKLGVTHLYASPFLKARSGSTHGYDIIDHNVINPELGGEQAFERMSAALRQQDLGLILDFVPNHMGVHFADNSWWLDVLEWGAASPHADFFDIDWDTLPYRAKGGVLLPILGSFYGDALDKGEIELRYDAQDGSFSAWYYEHRLPITPNRYSEILRVVIAEADASNTPAGAEILALASRYTGLRRPSQSEAPVFKAGLAAVRDGQATIERGLSAYRAGPDRPSQTQALHNLLERQHYKLGHWRLATSEINYRRFFDVNSLAGLRVETKSTFDGIHKLVKRLIAEDKLQGLRLDHIDGLRDPAQYCQRLTRLIGEARGGSRQPFYLLIEKILGEGEQLPQLHGVHGTTGYEWLNVITHVLLDGNGLKALDEVWRQASNVSPNFVPTLEEAKRRVLETLLASEFTVLSRLLARIAAGHYSTRDFSADSLRQALELYVLYFPVYRTYLTSAGPSPLDRDLISTTIEKARANWFGADEGIFDFLRDVLTLDVAKTEQSARGKPRIQRFAFKVQQFTGPMMAKSLEDTAFYRYHRLLALNEVGGDAAADALSVEAFHEIMQKRHLASPHGMTATATHDTKRGEDARTRLLAIAELSGEWTSLVGRWKSLNAQHVTTEDNMRGPSLAFEYMLYQAIVGAWPDRVESNFVERLQAFAIKASREAKLETSWLNPNGSYEKSLARFIERILDPVKSPEFLESIRTFVRRTSLLGALNSLAQITLKATMPGVPDFYQGTELWDYSFVDPDNRRPVDFNARSSELETMANPDWSRLAENWPDGRIKFAWTKRLLDLRRAHADVFSSGGYSPITVSGPHADHVIAFARHHRDNAVIVVVGRRMAKFTQDGRVWPSGEIDAVLDLSGYSADHPDFEITDGKLPVGKLFASFPATVLEVKSKRRSRTTSTHHAA